MSRKDYIAIAAILKAEFDRDQSLMAQEAIRRIAKQMAAMLAADNPRFNASKFMHACTGE